MQVMEVKGRPRLQPAETKKLSTEELQRELDYHAAQKLLEKLLEAGLVTGGEFDKITGKNRRSFSPCLDRIMP